MRLTATCLVILFLSIAPGNSQSTNDQRNDQTSEAPEKTSKDTSDQPTLADGLTIQVVKEENELDPDRDVTVDELLLFESLINDDTIFQVNTDSVSPSTKDGNVKDVDIDGTSVTPVESRVIPGRIGVRRQGELNPEFEKLRTARPGAEFDDSREQFDKDPTPRFGQRKPRPSSSRVREEAPVLQLTQGGYYRPYQKHTRVRNRQVERPESSKQSESVQEPERTTNGNNQLSTVQRIAPQVSYSAPVQQRPHPFGPGPVSRPAFEVPPRYVSSVNHIVPTTVDNRFLNTRQTNYLDYNTPPAFQTQFPSGNDIGYTNFARSPSNTDLYQPVQRNPFENAGFFFQGAPQMQTQPIYIDPARNTQPQFPPNNLPVYPNFENTQDGSRINFAQYFNTPSVNTQFQVPPNFYAANPNEELNAFNNPSGSFLSNYPGPSDNRFSSQFYRYPIAPNVQYQQQNDNDQQPASDDSQEDKRAKEEVSKEGNDSANSGNPTPASFGSRILPQNEDVFIRYPTNEAGYAIEENLPPQNSSVEPRDNGQRSQSERTQFPSRDPYREALNSVRGQRQNETRQYVPEELFRDVPVDFGYQRPQNSVFLQYPDNQRDVARYPTPDFNSRGSFDSFAPVAENNYPFLNAVGRASDKVPSCAKNNISFCFEDSEYPRNDVLYSINSNPYLVDRLYGPADLKLDSVSLVEQQNDTQTKRQDSENYACAVNTKYGSPMRAKNLEGSWRVIVNVGKLTQPVRMEACRSIGDSCSYADSKTKTACVQKFSLQRLLTWTRDRGIFLDVFKIPVACSCQILAASDKV